MPEVTMQADALAAMIQAAIVQALQTKKEAPRNQKVQAAKEKLGVKDFEICQDKALWQADLIRFCPATHQIQEYTGIHGTNAGKVVTNIQRGYRQFSLTLAVNGKANLADLAVQVATKKQGILEDLAFLEGMERYISDKYSNMPQE